MIVPTEILDAIAADAAEARANRSGPLLTLVTDSIPAYISYIDSDLRYVFINRTYQLAFGRTAAEIEGRPVSEVHGPSFENIRHHLYAALSGETQHFETLMGPEKRTLAVTHIPHRDDAGNILGVIVYGNDVTDRRRTEVALMQSEKLAAVGRLASSIAHEINNPLEAITNLIYLARAHAVNPLAQQYLDTADQELRRVSVIANQTLRFHKQSTSPRAITAANLLETVLTIYEGRLRNSNIEVLLDLRSDATIVCFEGDIRQVLNNLVGNAIDAMPFGGRLLLRSHQTTHPRPGLSLTVADTGSGMSPETAARIFEAFFTTKDIGGTGLGLWVTKEIVERHKGSLIVRSRPNRGTVFRLFIPHPTQS